jgi:hypothetical protein
MMLFFYVLYIEFVNTLQLGYVVALGSFEIMYYPRICQCRICTLKPVGMQ